MAQIQKKFIAANAIDDTKIRLLSQGYLRARNAADTADIDLIHTDADDAIALASLPYVEGSPLPSAPADLVTVAFAQSLVSQSGVRPSARIATTVALSANTYVNGTAGVGATLTGTANAALENIDGVQPVVNDRLLIKDEVTQANNGVYVVTQIGDGATPYILTRVVDANSSTNIVAGMFLSIQEGSVSTGKIYVMNTPEPIVVGTTNLTFVGTALGQSMAFNKENPTLSGTDITNQYFDLAHMIAGSSLDFVIDGVTQTEGVDYSVDLTGGAGGVTRVTFLGDLATGGVSELIAGDAPVFKYAYSA